MAAKTGIEKKSAIAKKSFTLRVFWGIILVNFFFLAVSAVVILVSMWNNAERTARELSAALIEEIQNSVKYRTINYFYPAQTVNHNLGFLINQYFQDPLHNEESERQLFDYYKEIQSLYPQFKMVYYADTNGDLMMLLRMEDGTFSKRRVHNTGTQIQTRYDHANPDYYPAFPNIDEPAGTGYDPRKRPWYGIAKSTKSIAWTPVYLFATGHLPGFTCTTPIFDGEGKMTGVSSVDIAADELSRFLGTLRPTPGAKIVILDKENNLVALQARHDEDLNALFVTAQDARGDTIYDVLTLDAYTDDSLRPVLQQLVKEPGKQTRIKQGGKNYEAILTPISVGAGLELNIGIVVPEDDITGSVRKNLRKVMFFAVALLILILAVSLLLSNAISIPMRRLADEMLKIRTFELESKINIKTVFLEIINMRDSFESMRSGLRNFKRYVPEELVAHLVREDIKAELGGERRELTIFFSDIVNFTTIAEEMDTEQLVLDLHTYFEIVSQAIQENRGTIDKYIGDSVMAFWGAPIAAEKHAERACLSALLIQKRLSSLFTHWKKQNKVTFPTRIGIHTGEVIVGNLGYHERFNYTVIGDTVNVSSRLETLNRVYGTAIIVSESTRNQCLDSFDFRRLDRVSVMGRKKEFEIYELLALKGGISNANKKLCRYYETGLQYYFDKQWDKGLEYFNGILKYRPDDNPSKVLRERCLRYKQKPPPPEWNGIFIQLSKEH